jgi:hypothetical protein
MSPESLSSFISVIHVAQAANGLHSLVSVGRSMWVPCGSARFLVCVACLGVVAVALTRTYFLAIVSILQWHRLLRLPWALPVPVCRVAGVVLLIRADVAFLISRRCMRWIYLPARTVFVTLTARAMIKITTIIIIVVIVVFIIINTINVSIIMITITIFMINILRPLYVAILALRAAPGLVVASAHS